MKKIILLFVAISSLCFLSKISNAQSPDWLWAKSVGGVYNEKVNSVAVDVSGNIYVAGDFTSDTLIFGSTTLTNASYDDFPDIFLAKYDANGNVLWAKSAGGKFGDEANSVAVDASGNIYVTGDFESPTITFDSTTLTNAGFNDIFLTKYDANGNVLWAKSAGGKFGDEANSVAVDASGNIYVAGNISTPTFTFDSITSTLEEDMFSDNIFLAKYDANGNVLWEKSVGGEGEDYASSVAVDVSGNIYVSGDFESGALTFGSTTLVNTSESHVDIFLAKYDANGNVLWAKSAGGKGDDEANSVAVDASGNIYVTGDFKSPTITFSSTTFSNPEVYSIVMNVWGYTYCKISNNADLFLAKYDANGNVLWAKSAGSKGDDVAKSVAVDASGNTYLVGYFSSHTLTFGSVTLTNADNAGPIDISVMSNANARVFRTNDIFLAKYDANGNVLWAKSAGGTDDVVQWAKSAGGTDDDVAQSVAVDVSGNTYVAGKFQSPTLTIGYDTLTNAGSFDIFLVKSGSDGDTGINDLSKSSNNSVSQNTYRNNINTPFKPDKQAADKNLIVLNEFLITENSVGYAYLGQTFKEVKNAYKNFKITRFSNSGAYYREYLISKNGIDYLSVSNSEYSDGYDTIYSITALSDKYSTKEGIHPKSTVGKLKSVYPAMMIRNSTMYCDYESCEPENSNIIYEFIDYGKGHVGNYDKSDGLSTDIFDTTRLITDIKVENHQ